MTIRHVEKQQQQRTLSNFFGNSVPFIETVQVIFEKRKTFECSIVLPFSLQCQIVICHSLFRGWLKYSISKFNGLYYIEWPSKFRIPLNHTTISKNIGPLIFKKVCMTCINFSYLKFQQPLLILLFFISESPFLEIHKKNTGLTQFQIIQNWAHFITHDI